MSEWDYHGKKHYSAIEGMQSITDEDYLIYIKERYKYA